MTTMKNILVTGAAGFIGFHMVQRLCAEGYNVRGLDNLNDYYDVQLKKDRLAALETLEHFKFIKADLADQKAIEDIFADFGPHIVINLAAQAGVRYSIDNPRAYIDSNVTGFMNILEGCRHHDVEHLVYASSSSVYGANTKVPFATSDNVDHPVSLYAATKKSGELMAHTYSHLYDIPTTGLRFFTVYGPWGRPDMAYFKFTQKMLSGAPIDIYNDGDMRRDFTYIDDIIEAMMRMVEAPPTPDPDWSGNAPNPQSSAAPYRLYNIGKGQPQALMDMIETLEGKLGVKAVKNFMPMQPGDVYETYADCTALEKATGYTPQIELAQGLDEFLKWYRDYYGVE